MAKTAAKTEAPNEVRGSAFGLLAAVQSFGNLAASGIAGIIWTAFSPRAAFIYIAGWMFVAAVTLIFLPALREGGKTRLTSV